MRGNVLRHIIGLVFVTWMGSASLWAQPSGEVPADTLLKMWLDSAALLLRQGAGVEAQALCLKTNELAREVGNDRAILGSNIGLINLNINDDLLIDSILSEIYPIIQRVNTPNYWFEYYVDMGQVANLRMQYDQQIIYSDSALQIALETGDTLGAGIVYIEMSFAYSNIRNFEGSKEMGRKALGLFEQVGIDYYIG